MVRLDAFLGTTHFPRYGTEEVFANALCYTQAAGSVGLYGGLDDRASFHSDRTQCVGAEHGGVPAGAKHAPARGHRGLVVCRSTIRCT